MLKDSQSLVILRQETKGRPWWADFLWVLVNFLLVGGLAGAVLSLPLVLLHGGQMTPDFLFWMNILGFPVMMAFILWIGKVYDNRSVESFGFFKQKWLEQSSKGIIIGFILFLLVWLVALVLGTVKLGSSSNSNVLLLVGIFFGFMVQGTTEEVICRGFLMNKMRLQVGLWPAILGNSLLFAAIHLGNDGVTPLSIVNLVLYGVVFSLLFVWSDNMWLTGLAHGMWNYTQGAIFGVLVSGSRVPSTMLATSPILSKSLLNGGSFGLEGGLITTAFGLLSCLILWHLIKAKYQKLA